MKPAARLVLAGLFLGLAGVLSGQTTFSVGNAGQLNTAISTHVAGDTIEFTADISLAGFGQLSSLGTDVTINGNGHTLDGAAAWRGFTIYAGQVAITGLTIANTRALGGDGGYNGRGGGGGGGLGAGGALFIRTGASVTLTDVVLLANSAAGGRGGFASSGIAGSQGGGGGGGMAGAGTNPQSSGAAAPGGGDVNGQGGSTASVSTGNAGFGGGGQGSSLQGGLEFFGGSGGFGGGGGGGSALVGGSGAGSGGIGGYGAGGGGGNGNGSLAGTSGFAGGVAQAGLVSGGFTQGWGASGASLGGAIFLMEGAALTVAGGFSQSGGNVRVDYADQRAAGSGLFLQGNGTLGFAPGSAQTVTLADQIADEAGTGFPVVTANSRPSDIGGGTGVWGLTKSGAGTLVLGGENSFTGATTVAAGTLVLDGSTRSATTVQSGATLGGGGTFHALATIENGGALAPGNSPGMITFASGLTINDGATFSFELGTVSDLILVTGGTLTGPASAGGATFHFSAGSGFGAGTYTLINGTGASLSGFSASDFTGDGIGGYSFTFGLSGHVLSVTATAIPEPAAYAALFGLLALGAVAVRRARAQGARRRGGM